MNCYRVQFVTRDGTNQATFVVATGRRQAYALCGDVMPEDVTQINIEEMGEVIAIEGVPTETLTGTS